MNKCVYMSALQSVQVTPACRHGKQRCRWLYVEASILQFRRDAVSERLYGNVTKQ